MNPPKNKKRTEKPPAIDKLIMPASGIVIALLVYLFMKGMKSEIPRIDMTDELALREVFFGEGEGKNYVVLCDPALKDNAKATPISSVFSDAHLEYKAAQFVIIDCEYQLPSSGKSIMERFSLDTKKRPTIFISGRIGPPKQISPKYLKSGTTLTNFLSATLEPHAAKVENSKDLKLKCLDKDWCGLLMKGGTPENYIKTMMKNLLTKYENIQFASVDSSSLFLSNLEEYLPEYKKSNHRFVLFKKVSGGLATGKDGKEAQGRLITSILPLDGKELSLHVISDLIESATSGDRPMKRLPSLPQVKIRSKKLEEQDSQKRQRSKKRADASKDSQDRNDVTANDGSKEGRRLEREKRRDEHRKTNPNYRQKTPEEMAEIERQRRIRMQEEAEKWNVRDADVPVDEGNVDYSFDEDVELDPSETDEDDDDADDENEDELFDLD